MLSQIIERTPSIYFKFDDQSHKNFSKSSLAFDYSISNQKAVVSSRFNRVKISSINKQISQNKRKSTPQKQYENHRNDLRQDQFMKLYGCKDQIQQKNQSKLKTEEFFEEFQQKFVITFDQEEVFVNQWSQESEGPSSKISKGNLNFQAFQVQQTMKLIKIESKDFLNKNESLVSRQSDIQSKITLVNLSQKISQTIITCQQHNQKTHKKQNNIKICEINQAQSGIMSSDKQNTMKNSESQFEQIVSFGPVAKQSIKQKIKKYKASNNRNIISKDFENNSFLLERVKPIIDTKRRVPLKSIENLIYKNSQERNRSQTRKKQIINTDLLTSTINKGQNTNSGTNGVWSNPINNKKSSSLQCTFNYDNMFKTNAFKETLKSTTLQNWKKKYHMRIQNLGDKKTVTKRARDVNIFENLFIRA